MVPDNSDPDSAWKRVTHLGIGAHPDDLEFMALHGILACYDRPDLWFGGITCTGGSGSPQAGGRPVGESELIATRQREQDEAARIGRYSVMAQLGYSSADAKNPDDDRLTLDLADILSRCRPQTVYTHNPADKHETHIAVVHRVIRAIRSLPLARRPQRLLGCEVWRSLDWLPDESKVVLDVGTNPELADRLTRVYRSQIEHGGKRYDLAVRGRERANATFLASHAGDGPTAAWYAMDLTSLIASDHAPSVSQFVNDHIARFNNDVREKQRRWE